MRFFWDELDKSEHADFVVFRYSGRIYCCPLRQQVHNCNTLFIPKKMPSEVLDNSVVASTTPRTIRLSPVRSFKKAFGYKERQWRGTAIHCSPVSAKEEEWLSRGGNKGSCSYVQDCCQRLREHCRLTVFSSAVVKFCEICECPTCK